MTTEIPLIVREILARLFNFVGKVFRERSINDVTAEWSRLVKERGLNPLRDNFEVLSGGVRVKQRYSMKPQQLQNFRLSSTST